MFIISTLLIIVCSSFLMLILCLTVQRISDKNFKIRVGKPYWKSLDELIYKEYFFKREGFGPYWFWTRESDKAFRKRAVGHHLRRYSIYRALPPWL